MEESGIVLEDKKQNEGQGLLAFFYGDAILKAVEHDEKTTIQETVRLAYKEVRGVVLYKKENYQERYTVVDD